MTGHLKGEESPVFQLPYTGSCVQILKNIMIPGIDALERDAGNNFYPRLACSVANQFGDGECLAEAFGGSGWGICPDDIINYCDWLTSHGLNNIVFHINQYVLKSKAIRDWPPSFPCHIAKSVQSSNISI
jgi:hypothetical protein